MYGLKPQKPAPDLQIDTLDQQAWRLSGQTPGLFTMIVFYRGLFCGTCREYLRTVHARLKEFEQRGVNILAVSMDTREQAEESRAHWQLDGLNIGYGLTVDEAERWGLFISGHSNPQGATEVFSQPGLFLIRPDRTIYSIFLQSDEFARPNMDQILAAIDFITAEHES